MLTEIAREAIIAAEPAIKEGVHQGIKLVTAVAVVYGSMALTGLAGYGIYRGSKWSYKTARNWNAKTIEGAAIDSAAIAA
jgi:hypothetical protein